MGTNQIMILSIGSQEHFDSMYKLTNIEITHILFTMDDLEQLKFDNILQQISIYQQSNQNLNFIALIESFPQQILNELYNNKNNISPTLDKLILLTNKIKNILMAFANSEIEIENTVIVLPILHYNIVNKEYKQIRANMKNVELSIKFILKQKGIKYGENQRTIKFLCLQSIISIINPSKPFPKENELHEAIKQFHTNIDSNAIKIYKECIAYLYDNNCIKAHFLGLTIINLCRKRQQTLSDSSINFCIKNPGKNFAHIYEELSDDKEYSDDEISVRTSNTLELTTINELLQNSDDEDKTFNQDIKNIQKRIKTLEKDIQSIKTKHKKKLISDSSDNDSDNSTRRKKKKK